MKKYYVSLVYDLLGCYLEYTAESERAVREYLTREYLRNGVYKLPWCSVYDDFDSLQGVKFIIPVSGTLYEEDEF